MLKSLASSALSTLDGEKEKGYESLPPLEETVATHICPLSAKGCQSKVTHPSKPSRTTSAFTGRAYASTGRAALALHTMAIHRPV